MFHDGKRWPELRHYCRSKCSPRKMDHCQSNTDISRRRQPCEECKSQNRVNQLYASDHQAMSDLFCFFVFVLTVFAPKCKVIRKWDTKSHGRHPPFFCVITAAKELFQPKVYNDNGLCFTAVSFQEFATNYGFLHMTSSPRYPRANGEVERAVRTVKGLLKINDDPYLALLSYRSTPLQTGLSPSELFMGRRLRTQLSVLAKTLAPRDLRREREEVVKKEEIYKSDQRQSFNQLHQAKELPDLTSGDSVWITDHGCLRKIQEPAQYPRSFITETEKGTLQRNRSGLVKAELQSPSKVHKQTTFTSTASNHAV